MIKIRQLENIDTSGLLKIVLTQAQSIFAENAKSFVESQNSDEDKFVILNESNTFLGYFKIDRSYSKKMQFANTKSLGLKSFVIDAQFQGQGIGSQVLQQLLIRIPVLYSEFDRLYLTVNCKNNTAYQCYLKNGFVAESELYMGGAAGAQYIMSYTILSSKNDMDL